MDPARYAPLVAWITLFCALMIAVSAMLLRMAYQTVQPIIEFARQCLIDRANKRIQLLLAQRGVSTSQLEASFLAGIGIGVWMDGDFKEIDLPLQVCLKRDGKLIPVPRVPNEPEGGF